MKSVLFSGLMFLATSAFSAPNTFKMYGEPKFKADPGCDRYLSLSLSAKGKALKAELRDSLGGYCEMVVPPNPRSYVLASKGDDGCGSKIYESSKAKLTDHRARFCENVVPAAIVFEEGNRTWYSQDQ